MTLLAPFALARDSFLRDKDALPHMQDFAETPAFPTAQDLAAGLPQFEVEQCLSVGQESAIYLGMQPALERRVMIRVMAEPTTADAATRLMDRLRARARLVHPRIVAVYDFGRSLNGYLYLVTEHVDGRMLCDLIQERAVSPKMAYGLALQLCDILSLLHGQGSLHGCLNTRTLLVDKEGQMKVTGIGMCLTPSGEISWLQEGAASIEQDLYDLGLVLHEMFAKEPLDGEGKVSRNIPPAFGAVLRRCLHAEIGRRYPSAAEIKEALVQALRTQQSAAAKSAAPISSATPHLVETQRAPAPAHPAAAVAPSPAPAAAAASKPTAAAVAPPRYAPGRPPAPVVRAQPSFMKKLDDFLWSCLRASLHLAVFGATAAILLIFYVMKDKIVLDPDADLPVAQEPALPGEMLGSLPPAPELPQTPVTPLSTPISLPPPAPKADPLAGLKAEYRAAVQAEATAALDRVNLNELPAFQQELKRLQNGEPIPEVDEPGIPASLKRLREDYRQKRAAQMR